MATNYNPRIVTDGLVLCLDAGNTKSYPGSGTTWTDLSGQGNNGTLTNMDGSNYSDGALSFDGSNEYVNLTESLIGSNQIQTVTSSYTLEAWINVRSSSGTTSGAASIIGNSGNYGVGMQVGVSNGNPRMNYGFRFTNNFYGSQFSYDTWTHICLSRIHGQSVKAYLNGNLDASFTSTELSVPSEQTYNNMRIGNSSPRITGYYDGYISNIRVYNKGLTDAEVQQNFNALRGRFGI